MGAPANTRRDDQWDPLILRYLDGSLPEAEIAKVTRFCADPQFQRLLAEYALDHAVMYETAGNLGQDEAPSPSRFSRVAKVVPWKAAAAVLLVALTIGSVRLFTWGTDPARELPTIRRIMGQVVVDGQPSSQNQPLLDGQLVKTLGFASFASLSFDDGTELELSGNTSVSCRSVAGSKRVDVLEGRLSASVAPQPPDRALLITTSAALMKVVGTNLAVTAVDDETRLNVASGSVQMRRERDGEEVLVRKGEYAIAGADGALSARQAEAAPGVWRAHFLPGAARSWTRGVAVPPDRHSPDGAVIAEFADEDGMWLALTKNAWSEGLFLVEEDTYLNYRLKMSRPQWYQVLIFVRDDLFQAPGGQPYHEFQEPIDFNQLKPDEWRTVSVPLSEFRLTQTDGDSYPGRPINPPPLGATVFRFLFSTQKEDRGLVIDKVWVTRGRPDVEPASTTE